MGWNGMYLCRWSVYWAEGIARESRPSHRGYDPAANEDISLIVVGQIIPDLSIIGVDSIIL